MSFLKIVLEIIKTLAAFAWPFLLACVVYTFRLEIKAVLTALPKALGQLTEADVFGVKLQLRSTQEAIVEAASAVVQQEVVRAELPTPKVPTEDGGSSPLYQAQRIEATSASGQFRRLVREIDREVRTLMASNGLLDRYISVGQAVELLADRNLIPDAIRQAVQQFTSLRNSIEHSDNVDVLPTGTVLVAENMLAVIKSVPRSRHEVIRRDVQLFSDPEATDHRAGVVGVILLGQDQYGNRSHAPQIFPTTHSMKVGAFVSWEWNLSKSWGETWFRDSDTGDIHMAWSSSAEFVGRDIEEV